MGLGIFVYDRFGSANPPSKRRCWVEPSTNPALPFAAHAAVIPKTCLADTTFTEFITSALVFDDHWAYDDTVIPLQVKLFLWLAEMGLKFNNPEKRVRVRVL